MTCLLFFLLPLAGCSSPALAAPVPPPGGEVRLWQDAAIFQLVGELIDSAQTRVLVEMYELGRGEIVASLGAAKARGVAVRVITDPTVTSSRESAGQLDALGVAERAYPVDDARHQIDHVKLLIADGQAAVGGMNWGRHSERNHDYVLQSRVVADVDRLALVFEQDWALAGGHPAPLPAWSGSVAQTGPGSGIRILLEATDYVVREKGAADASIAAIAEKAGVAQGSVYQYFPTKMAVLAAWEEHGAISTRRLE